MKHWHVVINADHLRSRFDASVGDPCNTGDQLLNLFGLIKKGIYDFKEICGYCIHWLSVLSIR